MVALSKQDINFIVGQQFHPRQKTLIEIEELLHHYNQPVNSDTLSASIWAYLLGEVRGVQKERAKRNHRLKIYIAYTDN